MVICSFDAPPRSHSFGARRCAPVHLAPLDSVLAYQAVQVIRRKLKEHGINESWATLREKLGSQYRITAIFKQRDGKTLHIRQATRPEEELSEIYTKLGLAPDPGGLQKMLI